MWELSRRHGSWASTEFVVAICSADPLLHPTGNRLTGVFHVTPQMSPQATMDPDKPEPNLGAVVERYNRYLDVDSQLWGFEGFIEAYVTHGRRVALTWADKAFCRKVR